MKKLLIASDCFLPRWDGIARFLLEIIPRIKDDYEITVIAPDFKGHYDNECNINIKRVPLFNFELGDYHPPKFSFKTIKEEVKNADLVWVQTIGPIGALAVKYGKKYKKPVIAFIHSIEWELVSESLTKTKLIKKILSFITKKIAVRLYNKCTLLIVPSKETEKSLNKIKALKTIIYLGTDTAKFKPPESKEEAKRKIKINPESSVVGFCGRIGREKDLKTIYRAFLRLEKKHPNLVLLIVGKGLKQEEEFFKKRKNIILTGSVNNVVPYLQAMDIYVLPSLTETSSLSTLEAMSCGLAVLSTKVGYVNKYIREKVNGMFFPKQNYFVLSLKLEWLLKNKKLREILGKNARKTIIKKSSWEMTVKKIKKALDSA